MARSKEIDAQRKELVGVYKDALKQGEMNVAYSRVMALGASGVGKTNLKRGLMKLPFNPRSNSTVLSDVDQTTSLRTPLPPVRPLDYEWVSDNMSIEWKPATREDKLNELAHLLASVHHGVQTRKTLSARSLYPVISLPQIDSTSSRQDEVGEVLYDVAKQAKSIPVDDVKSFEPQPFHNIWDCGGQPVFLEILPTFLTSRTMFLLLYDASKSFREKWKPVQQIDGEVTNYEDTDITILDLMFSWMSNIHVHFAQLDDKGAIKDYPRMLCIGTHGDKLATPEAKDDAIKALKDEYKDKEFTELVSENFIVDNTTAGSENEDVNFLLIREAIHKFATQKLVVKTPIKWLLFGRVIEILNSKIISLQQAISIGKACLILPEDVPKVLLFFHDLGVLLYYPNIEGMQETIIISPKWFVDTLGKVFTLKGQQANQIELHYNLLHNKGILVRPYYVAAWKDCGISPDALMKLLVHFHLAAEINTSEYRDDTKQYFLPAVLKSYTGDTTEVDLGFRERATCLHITFRTEYVPPGYYTRFVTCIAEEPQCKLEFGSKQHGTCIYRNRVIFTYGIDRVVLSDLHYAVQVDVLRIAMETPAVKPFNEVCQELVKILKRCDSKVTQVFQTSGLPVLSKPLVIPSTFRYVCNNCSTKIHPLHYLKLPSSDQQTSNLPLCCDINGTYRRPNKEEAYWFVKAGEIDSIKSKRVTEIEMEEISRDIGDKADSLAARLGKLNRFKALKTSSNNPVLYLLHEWEQGGGERQQLVDALNKIGLSHLANRIALETFPPEATIKLPVQKLEVKELLTHDIDDIKFKRNGQSHGTFKKINGASNDHELELMSTESTPLSSSVNSTYIIKTEETDLKGMDNTAVVFKPEPQACVASAHVQFSDDVKVEHQRLPRNDDILTENDILRCSRFINRRNDPIELANALRVTQDDIRKIDVQHGTYDRKMRAYHIMLVWFNKNDGQHKSKSCLQEKLDIIGFTEAAES